MITYSQIYQDIATLLDREDLEQDIPTWVRLAEKQIYRFLRVRHNENTTVLTEADNPIVPIDLPAGFKEMRLLLVNDVPMVRVSDQRFKADEAFFGITGEPSHFSTIDNQLYIDNWPTATPDDWGTVNITIHYYAQDSYELLEMGEDAFIYGGAFHGAVSLKAPPDQRAMYEDLFSKALVSLDAEHKKQEYAGSTLSVSSAY